MSAARPAPLPPALLAVLACPKCKGRLDVDGEGEAGGLRCPACRLRYRVDGGVPVLLIDEAEAF